MRLPHGAGRSSDGEGLVPRVAALRLWLAGAVLVVISMAAVPVGFAAGGLGFSWGGALIWYLVAIGAASHVLTAPVAVWRLLKADDAGGQEWAVAVVGWTVMEWVVTVFFLRWMSSPFPV